MFDVSEWWDLLRQTLVYSAAAALGVVYFRVAVILMSLISTGVQTGYFSVAFRILEIVAGIPWLVVTAAFPVMARAARDDGERLRYSLQRIFEVSAIVSVWMAVVIYLGAPFAIEVVGGDGFEPAVDVLRVLGTGADRHVPRRRVGLRAALAQAPHRAAGGQRAGRRPGRRAGRGADPGRGRDGRGDLAVGHRARRWR